VQGCAVLVLSLHGTGHWPHGTGFATALVFVVALCCLDCTTALLHSAVLDERQALVRHALVRACARSPVCLHPCSISHPHSCTRLFIAHAAHSAAPPAFNPQENKLGQKFVVDATLVTDLSHAGHSDDVMRTVNYAEVYE